MGYVAGIGGFLLLAVIVWATIYTKSRKPTPGERREADEATRALYREDSQSRE